MTITQEKLQEYADTRAARIIAMQISQDGKSAVLVFESGQKLTLYEDEINIAIGAAPDSEPPKRKKGKKNG